MHLSRTITTALAFVLLTLPSHASAQSLSDIRKLHELAQPISKLNPPDRHAILHTLQITAQDLRGEEVSANGLTTFFIQAAGLDYCGATGNCSFWVFDAAHHQLLKTTAQSATYIASAHNGKPDLLIARHDSATQTELRTFHFDGRQYHLARCSEVIYAGADGNQLHPPRIEPRPCR